MKPNPTFLLAVLLFFPFLMNAQIVNVPDLAFANALKNTICADLDGNGSPDDDVDTNNDGEIQVSEAQAVFGLNLISRHISSFTGIEEFVHLKVLYCSGNLLTTIPLEQLTELTNLDCNSNNLTELNVQYLVNLQDLICFDNPLEILDVQNLTQLHNLDCSACSISHLDIQNLHSLYLMNCALNNLTNLDASGLDSLIILDCFDNHLTSLNVQGMSSLTLLSCENNQLTTLDVQDVPNLYNLYCDNNLLSTLFIKNGSSMPSISVTFDNNPLIYICCNENQIQAIQQQATSYGLTNCSVNSFCGFTPENEITHSLQGQIHLDLNINGCDNDDPAYPGIQFHISDGMASGVFVANQSGNYNIALQAGGYTVVPVIENPDYFTVNPDTLELSLSTMPETVFQDFCVTPNGLHHDVEVEIIPLSPARPGFEAAYKIFISNKANQPENGSVSFVFDNNIMGFISADILPDAQVTDTLRWNFTDLAPLSKFSVNATFLINSPGQTPPVNPGDVLPLTALTSTQSTDEAPEDNIFQLLQTVVGSYDPNDKTCLEGAQITPAMVGGYLNYLIRFENTGTFPAENIVVKDVIDPTVFDLSSLRLVEASHPCVTRINGDQVDFIFENIQLPFTEPDKHGFVQFKIKTKQTLELGNQVMNKASIYFDYNLPVITNTATTTISNTTATHQQHQQGLTFETRPNPATDVLYLLSERAIDKVELYDALGRIVLFKGAANKEIDIARLPAGIYTVKAYGADLFGVKQVEIIKR